MYGARIQRGDENFIAGINMQAVHNLTHCALSVCQTTFGRHRADPRVLASHSQSTQNAACSNPQHFFVTISFNAWTACGSARAVRPRSIRMESRLKN